VRAPKEGNGMARSRSILAKQFGNAVALDLSGRGRLTGESVSRD
jgi:hypothetical protein